MADGYEYDVFLSAASETPVGEWVDNHFLGMLRIHLGNEMPPERKPRVFWFKEQETGIHWKENLQKILPRSRILVSVLSPHYFRSEWCMAEFESMREREKMLRMGSVEYPDGLIYPVLFSDGEFFEGVRRVAMIKDLSKWRYHWPQFRDSEKYLGFDEEMRTVGSELVKQIMKSPDWEKDFPVIMKPKTLEEPVPKLPRIL